MSADDRVDLRSVYMHTDELTDPEIRFVFSWRGSVAEWQHTGIATKRTRAPKQLP